jgi:predicted dehydrogenase
MTISKKNDAKLGFGIIGTGGWANTHARACKANPHVEIVGLSEVREGVAELFARANDIDVPIFADYHKLLAMDGLDAVIIATPNNVHAPIAIAAAEAGKHILCQKPMANTLSDAEAMVAAVEKAGVQGMVAYTKRFFKSSPFLHYILRNEDLGHLYHVRAFYFQSWLSNPATPVVWRLQREMTGTGVLGDLGAHIIDLVQYLVGDDIIRVTAMMKTFVTERPSLTDGKKKETCDVDDAVMFGAEFKNGAMGVFQASRNATGRPDHWRVEIDAEKGAIIYDGRGSTFVEQGIYADTSIQINVSTGLARHAGWVELKIPARRSYINRYSEDEHQNQTDYFVECIRSGQTPAPSFADGLKTERIMDAVVRSCRTGAAMDVE